MLSSQMPVLEVDGVQLAQSQAIDLYVAGLANLLPADPFLTAKCIEINQAFAVSANAVSCTSLTAARGLVFCTVPLTATH